MSAPSTLTCRVQYLDDMDPFTMNFPEPAKAPNYIFLTNVQLLNQVAGLKRVLKAPHKVSKLWCVQLCRLLEAGKNSQISVKYYRPYLYGK